MTTSTPLTSHHPAAITLVPGSVSLAELRRIHAGGVTLQLDSSALAGMQAAQAVVQRIVDEDQVVYGINTGFGKLASTKIAHDRLAELQRNLVLSHSVGTGDALPDGVVRLILATKAVSLARGHSGIRPAMVDALLALANANGLRVIPAKGAVGASGDLAPLADLSCVLIGEGQAKVDGKVVSGADAMRAIGLRPFVLGPKEGLALLNGTQVSTALALAGFSFAAFLTSHALAALWPHRRIEQVVLVGTAASRFSVAPLPPEAHLRSLVVHGEQDDTVPLSAVLDWARPQALPITVVPGGGHFFHGQLPLLKNLVVRHLQSGA